MKKFLLSILLIASVNFIFAQTQTLPCPVDYKINNGGGNCPDTVINGVTISATGSVTLTFDGPVPPNNIPQIITVFEILPGPDTLITGIFFGPGQLNANGTVTYCYYSGPNNNNNLNGRNRQFRFNVFYNGIPCGSTITLPVSLVSFTAMRNNSNVTIRWTTATEINNLGFQIQRLVGNGSSWQDVFFVPSQAAGGNSSSNLSYSFTDLNNSKGITQYRLRQTDIDSRYKFSEIRAVRGEGQLGKTIVYPNPSSDGRVNIVFDEVASARQVSLTDMSGRIIRQWKAVDNNNIQIENLNPGMYILRIVIPGTGEQSMQKIIVNNR